MRRVTLSHRLQHLAYRPVLALLRWIPEGWALKVGAGAGWMAGVVFGLRKREVRRHLLIAFPEKDDVWRRDLLHASFRHLGREAVATFLFSAFSKEEILDRTEIVDFERIREALAGGKGLLFVTGHMGNWEVGAAAFALRGLPFDMIVQRQRNPLFDVDINANRVRLGVTLIMRGDAPKGTLRSLKAGRMVGIAGDQNIRRGGVFVDFFGKKSSTARGIAVFALRTGAPVFFGVSRRLPGPRARYQWTFRPLDFKPTGDMEADVLALTQAHTACLEEAIRETPDQYFWQHRRWKTQPPPP